MNKRAMAARQVLNSILLVAVLIVLLIIAQSLFLIIKETVRNNQCHQSVMSIVISKVAKLETSQIDCKTNYVKIPDKNEDSMKRKIADEMVGCWYNFGEGKYEFFGNTKDERVFCFVCSHIQFGNENKNMKISNFSKFLQGPAPGKNVSYFEYFTSFKTSDDLMQIIETGISDGTVTDALSTNTEYAILFMHAKKDYVTKVEAAFEGAKWGAGIGGATGTALALFTPLKGGIVSGAIYGMTAGALIWYSLGSDKSADFASRIIIIPVENLTDTVCQEIV